MPQNVHNLGRAVGMSAWEIYVRQSLLLNPDIEPLSEREWLSETIGLGTSMLLKITKDNTEGVHSRDIYLPDNSLLSAPNTIIGSFFNGEAAADDDGWCYKVTDYGVGISNTAASNPGNGDKTAHAVPTQSMTNTPSDLTKRRMLQYIRIQDAIVLQDGTWSNSETDAPAKTFVPDITKPAMLRITFQDKVTEDFYILLTGFVTRAIIKGETGFDMGSVRPDDEGEAEAYKPQNGDFLGPELYPWANKVVFTYPAILTYLFRDELSTDSHNLEIEWDHDTVPTLIHLSQIEAGPGVQVNDPSKDSSLKPAQKITISSRIETKNNYLKVVQQTAENTPDKGSSGVIGDSSKVPTQLIGSASKPGLGIAITQPANPGDDHVISSIIEVGKSEGGYNDRYLLVWQGQRDDATKTTTRLTPSYAMPDAGIGISQPESAGAPFTIGAKMATEGDGKNYIGIRQLKNSKSSDISTYLTPACPRCGRGVGITHPSTAGDDFVISAIIHSAGRGHNYLGVSQPDEQRSATEQSTELHPSKITPSDGIAITQPTTAGEDIKISSKMKTSGDAANYIAIAQSSHDGESDSTGISQFSTILTPSKVVGGKRISVSQPNGPGGDIIINNKIEFEAGYGVGITDTPFEGDGSNASGKVEISSIVAVTGEGALGLKVTQTRGAVGTPTTTLQPSHLVVDERNQAGTDSEGNELKDVLTITYPGGSGGDITWYIDVDEIMRRLLRSGPLNTFLKNFTRSLLDKIYVGNGEKAEIEWSSESEDFGKIIWPAPVEPEKIKIPMGNLNLYSNDGSGEVFEDALRSRDGNTSNDLRMK